MYMLINSSKSPQNYQIDQNTVLCFHTLYSEKPADNLQYLKVSSFTIQKGVMNLDILLQFMEFYLDC